MFSVEDSQSWDGASRIGGNCLVAERATGRIGEGDGGGDLDNGVASISCRYNRGTVNYGFIAGGSSGGLVEKKNKGQGGWLSV